MDNEIQIIENIIIQSFRMLDEYDKLIKVVENEHEKLGGEDLECCSGCNKCNDNNSC